MVRDQLENVAGTLREKLAKRRFDDEYEQVPGRDLRTQRGAEEAKKEAVREAQQEAREEYIEQVKQQRKAKVKQRATERISGGSQQASGGASLRERLAQLGARAGSAARAEPRGRDDQRETMERAYQAAHVSPPTDHDVAPVDDRGLGTLMDFVTGRRPAEGLQRFQQTADRATRMQWVGEHSDGSQTVVSTEQRGSAWIITAVEQAPSGRRNAATRIDTARSRAEARERALDWMERNPEGIPLHQQAGQYGAAGYATGQGEFHNSLVFGDPTEGTAADPVQGAGLVDGDDLDFVFGGDGQ